MPASFLPTPRIKNLTRKRDTVVRLLDSQVRVAKRLSRNSTYSFESRIAWEIVEELAQKLSKMEFQLQELQTEEAEYYSRMVHDDNLMERVYDI